VAAERVGAYPMLRKKSPLPGFLPARVFTFSGEGESPPTGFKKMPRQVRLLTFRAFHISGEGGYPLHGVA
jgi:hypothetical protein